ncbi:MAG: hypothetical protein JWN86_3703 [Planctomycetota bacterium]|nr:hypothetical protein [Planctomycetota bacterium]
MSRGNLAQTPRRRFTILDGLSLVAATAVGLGISRAVIAPMVGGFPTSLPDLKMAALVLLIAMLPVVWAWTLALIPLRLRGPRPSYRRLYRQPGWTAAIATLIGPLGEMCRWAWFILLPFGSSIRFDLPFAPFDVFRRLLPPIGLAVALAWTLLFLSGGWRAEPSWIDRLGRGLGAMWILGLPFLFWLAVIS